MAAEIVGDVTKKNAIIKSKVLYEAKGQAPAPSKDYVSVVITEKGVIWRRWKITLRGLATKTAMVPLPYEAVMTYEDYMYDDAIQEEIKRVFSSHTLECIDRVISGCTDYLSCISETTLLKICTMLDLQSITQLSHVSRYLRKVCNSDKLWISLYYQYQGTPSHQVYGLAREKGWKTVFYMSKLQLQKELSRRRKNLASRGDSLIPQDGCDGSSTDVSAAGSSQTFLTVN